MSKIVEINGINYGSTGNIAINIAEEAENAGYETYLFFRNSKEGKKRKTDKQKLIGFWLDKVISERLSYVFGLNGYFNIINTFLFTKQLDKIINDNCVFFKRDISNDMIPTDIYVNIEKHKSYDRFRKDKVFEDVIGDSMSAHRMGLKQLCSGFIKDIHVHHNKMDWLKDFLDNYDERVVIFYNFNMELEDIKYICNCLKRPYSVYNGSQKDLTNFEKYDNAVAICNYGSASLGLNNLVLSNVSIMYSPTDDYINFTQSRKRIDRLGQTKKPLFYYLQTKNSIEVAIYKALQVGQNFDDKMFDKYLQMLN